MNKKHVFIGVIIVSAIIAGGFAVVQSQKSTYAGMEEPYLAEESYVEVVPGEALMKEAVDQEMPAPVREAAAPEQRVIKTSYMSLEVKNFREAADAVGSIARTYGGYVSDSSVRDVAERKIGYVTVRVPSEKFEDIIKEIETIGDLKEENISLEDVTERYIDLKARLENLERQEERYLEILDMAVTVEDVLKVETQLERTRGTIESLQGTLNYLDNRIDYSTIQVQLSEPEKITHESGISRAFNDAIDGFLAAVRGIIIFLGYFVPIALFMTFLGFAGWFIYKKVSKGS
jgi:hypothetical protein